MKAVRFGAIAMPFFLACSLRPNGRVLKEALWMFYAAGLVSMITGVVFYAFDIDLGLDVQTFKFGDELHSRAVGIFGESGQFAHLLVTWVLVSLLLLPIIAPSAKTKVATLVAMLLGLVCLYLSLSRGATGNLLTTLIAAAVFPSTRRVLKGALKHLRVPLLLFAATAMVGVFLAIATALGDTIIQTLQLRFIEGTLEAYSENPDAASSGRLEAWALGLRRFQESPFLGLGYKAMMVGQYASSDNQYVGTLFDQGLLGLVALVGFILKLFGRLRQLARAGNPVSTMIQAIWIGQLVQAMTTDILTFWGGMPALLGITGLIAAGHPTQLNQKA